MRGRNQCDAIWLCGEVDCEGVGQCPCRNWDYYKKKPNLINIQEVENKMKGVLLKELRNLFRAPVITHQTIIQIIEDCEVKP